MDQEKRKKEGFTVKLVRGMKTFVTIKMMKGERMEWLLNIPQISTFSFLAML